MKVILTCTPEFSIEKLDEIVALLNSIPGELNFIKGKPMSQAQFIRLNKKFDNVSQISSLSFEEFFYLVQEYRDKRDESVKDEDYVILISSIRNSKRWFSAFDKKNIFVHGDDWDLISNVDSKFGIAYQCVENIFQSLIDLNISDVAAEPNIHMSAIGCINDFCGHKPEILRKLQSATICESCYQRAVEKGISDFIFAHIVSILEEIRKEFVISKRFLSHTKLDKVVIDEKGKIMIGDRVIKLDTLPKVMYINFLNHIEGIPTDKLCENRSQFDDIYKILRRDPDENSITKMCCKEVKDKNSGKLRYKSTFETYRSKIKMALRKKLGDILSNFYAINLITDKSDQNRFKIPLSNDQFIIHPKFTK